MPLFPVKAMQGFDFKNSIAIKRFLVMILNLVYFFVTSSNDSKYKEGQSLILGGSGLN